VGRRSGAKTYQRARYFHPDNGNAKVIHSRNFSFVLTGPARGMSKPDWSDWASLIKHLFLKDYPEVGRLFPVLDLYLVTARQEGGPKAVLELNPPIPPVRPSPPHPLTPTRDRHLVYHSLQTRVGQAMDIVKHGQNGWMVAVEDVDGLAKWSNFVYQKPGRCTRDSFS